MTGTTHRASQIYDILAQVFDQLTVSRPPSASPDDIEDIRGCRSGLARSARVCKKEDDLLGRLHSMIPQGEMFMSQSPYPREFFPLEPLISYENLRKVHINQPLKPARWEFLGAIQGLEELGADLGTLGHAPPKCQGFRSLRNLLCHITSWKDISWMDSITSGCLERLVISHHRPGSTPTSTWHLYRALEKICAKLGPTLCTIDIHITLCSSEGEKNTMCVVDMIRPLLQLHALEVLSLRAGYRSVTEHELSLSDAGLTEMAAAWPSLIALVIDIKTPPGQYVSFDALATAASMPPALRTLRLGGISSSSSTSNHEDVKPHSLRQLAFEDYAGDGAELARLVDTWFPNVNLTPFVEARGANEMQKDTRWGALISQLAQCKDCSRLASGMHTHSITLDYSPNETRRDS
ncbi:hypothetical protein CERSUDRAFT_95543 [Gelatoporia subvermispora B]|uniref:F-box domain-containing protein n=1 Tax=Ceriporiopsis subvermispora (strain B) TaxID=914234 RepID=M2QVS0_CERS8|nr:hypothetical protein CERSUDRAFT_95543 [Gelatoporia subvermispora B]